MLYLECTKRKSAAIKCTGHNTCILDLHRVRVNINETAYMYGVYMSIVIALIAGAESPSLAVPHAHM